MKLKAYHYITYILTYITQPDGYLASYMNTRRRDTCTHIQHNCIYVTYTQVCIHTNKTQLDLHHIPTTINVHTYIILHHSPRNTSRQRYHIPTLHSYIHYIQRYSLTHTFFTFPFVTSTLHIIPFTRTYITHNHVYRTSHNITSRCNTLHNIAVHSITYILTCVLSLHTYKINVHCFTCSHIRTCVTYTHAFCTKHVNEYKRTYIHTSLVSICTSTHTIYHLTVHYTL